MREAFQTEHPHNLVLWNDDVTPADAVVEALCMHLRYPLEKAVETMWYIHTNGRGVVYSGTFEVCELHYEQLRSCKLTVTIEKPE